MSLIFKNWDKVQEIIARYPEGKSKSALIPLLLMAQEEWGWLSTEAMDYVAGILHIKPLSFTSSTISFGDILKAFSTAAYPPFFR